MNHWNANAYGIHTWISATNNQNGTGNQLDLRQSSCRKVWIQSHFSHTVLVRYTCDPYLLRSFLKVLEHLERYSFGSNGFDFTLLSWTLYRLSISYIDVFYSFSFLFLVFDGFFDPLLVASCQILLGSLFNHIFWSTLPGGAVFKTRNVAPLYCLVTKGFPSWLWWLSKQHNIGIYVIYKYQYIIYINKYTYRYKQNIYI